MAERVQQVKGPGARPPRGVKPQVKNPMKIFTRIMKYALKDYTVHCIAVVIAIFVNVLANVQGTMFMKTLIDGYITPMLTQPDPDFGPLLHAILRVAGFYGIGIVAAFIQNRTMIYVSQGTLRNLRNDLFGNMEKLPIKYFDTHAHGDIMSIYTNDIDTLRQMISQSIPQIINSLCQYADSEHPADDYNAGYGIYHAGSDKKGGRIFRKFLCKTAEGSW